MKTPVRQNLKETLTLVTVDDSVTVLQLVMRPGHSAKGNIGRVVMIVSIVQSAGQGNVFDWWDHVVSRM